MPFVLGRRPSKLRKRASSRDEDRALQGKGAEPEREVYRLALQLSEFGDGKFRIEKTSTPPPDDFDGTPFTFSRWPKTKATKGKDGMFRLVHDFRDADPLAALALETHNLTVDKASRTLDFTPGPMPEKTRKAALFAYCRKCGFPLRWSAISCGIAQEAL